MVFVPRRAIKYSDVQVDAGEYGPVRLEELRGLAAWVLLGEPGAGKSKAFEMEALATEGVFMSIARFLSDEPDPAWHGKTLYLDGLDETRAGGGDTSTLLKLRAHLKRLGSPRFRIACRAADWFGSTDSQAISDVSQDGQLGVYMLDPLTKSEVEAILRENHGISDPGAFVENARLRGVEGLLDNPQTLGLLAEAIRDGQGPTTRLETFRLACRKLADEDSKQHRAHARATPTLVDEILAAAGQLFAVMLLSDKSGIALDRESANEHYPTVDDFAPADLSVARVATTRKLFRPAPDVPERLVPSHRSIAEFLAAQWLAERIDRQGLPLGRVLNLFLGSDTRTVSGLRGLYGWLALHCHVARQRLIDADPLTVILYGDVKPMSVDDKRRLLMGLQREAEAQIYYRWEIPSVRQLGALADEGLTNDFAAILGRQKRDDASQSMTACVLDVLGEAEPIPGLGPALKAIVLDPGRWPGIRRQALETWLRHSPSADESIALLDTLRFGQGSEADDELTGVLLAALYPGQIPAKELLGYLHPPKERKLVGGRYATFWRYILPRSAPEADLPILLDQLAGRTDLVVSDEMALRFDWYRMLGALLSRALQIHGDHIGDERLYAWLGIGADRDRESRWESEHRQSISSWLGARPQRYKAILGLCYRHCESAEHIRLCLFNQEHRLHGAPPPDDIGLWHLEQASLTAHDGLAEQHLYEAVRSLMFSHGCADLSLEKIEAWGEANPGRRHWLDSMLAWEIPEWRQEEAVRAKTRKLESAGQKRSKAIAISRHLETIQNGTAPPGVMHELAGVWLDHYFNTHGSTVQERFDSYCDNGREVLEAAEAGFFHCPERSDLPTVEEIVDLSTKRTEHYIRNPCLVGMELRWRAGESFVDCLSEEQLRLMLAFRLTYGAGNEPAWFSYLVRTRPALVAEVLVIYAAATLKARQDYVYGLYALPNDADYQAVAELAVIPLLTSFPVRIKSVQLSYLDNLLKAALRYVPAQLKGLLGRKLASKAMDVPQKVYWLTAGMLIDPPQYESELWQYIGKAWVRASHLCAFVSDRYRGLNNDYQLSAVTLSRLIELLAPHAELERRSGLVTGPMQLGENVHAMVTRLGALATQEAAREIDRLRAVPALGKLRYALDNARYQLQLKQREDAFRFPSLQSVASVLANQGPANVTDLAALTLDVLDQIANKIRRDNDDGFRAFWNVESGKPTGKREENLCRDVLLTRLRFALGPFGIDCQPEGDCANDKRADILISYRNEFQLPLEIKRDDNRELWGALRTQLMTQYASATKAAGYGVYLVLWFGKGDLPATRDGGKKPVSPDEFQTRLEALLNPEERRRIFIRVLDVSWPASR